MGSTPLYKKIKEQIIHSLVSGEWQPGEMIPNEKQLAERFGVAISTIRAAIGELVASDVLSRKQGKGTFVTEHNSPNAYRYFNLYHSDGSKVSFYRQLIRSRKESPDDETIRLLRLNGPEIVFKLRTHIHSKNTIIAVADMTVSQRLFPELDKNMSIEGDQSLYAVFQSTYNINVVRIVEQLVAAKAPAAIAKVLKLKAGEPLLQVKRTAFTFNNQPIELRTTWIHTKDYHYLVSRGDES